VETRWRPAHARRSKRVGGKKERGMSLRLLKVHATEVLHSCIFGGWEGKKGEGEKKITGWQTAESKNRSS